MPEKICPIRMHAAAHFDHEAATTPENAWLLTECIGPRCMAWDAKDETCRTFGAHTDQETRHLRLAIDRLISGLRLVAGRL